MDSARTQLAEVRLKLVLAALKAPFEAMVGSRSGRLGSQVGSGTDISHQNGRRGLSVSANVEPIAPINQVLAAFRPAAAGAAERFPRSGPQLLGPAACLCDTKDSFYQSVTWKLLGVFALPAVLLLLVSCVYLILEELKGWGGRSDRERAALNPGFDRSRGPRPRT